MNKIVKYADFECLLLQLGFRPGQTTGTQLLFEHPDFDAQIVLPPYQAEEAVQPHHWVNVRWLLDVKGILERDIEKTIPDLEKEIIMYCGGGYRSVLTAGVAQKIGYRKVSSLIGGYKGLVQANWPMKGGQ